MAVPLLGSVIATIVGAVAKTASIEVVKYTLMRAFLISVAVTLVPLILYNFVADVLQEWLAYASSVTPSGGGISAQIISLTGIGGWMAIKLKLPEAFSVVMGAVSVRWVLNFVPFVK